MYGLSAASKRSVLPSLPTPVAILCLFCLLGLTVSAAVLPMYSAADVTWAMAHIE